MMSMTDLQSLSMFCDFRVSEFLCSVITTFQLLNREELNWTEFDKIVVDYIFIIVITSPEQWCFVLEFKGSQAFLFLQTVVVLNKNTFNRFGNFFVLCC